MSGPIVVDVGNSGIKWGLCSSELVWRIASLPPDDAAACRSNGTNGNCMLATMDRHRRTSDTHRGVAGLAARPLRRGARAEVGETIASDSRRRASRKLPHRSLAQCRRREPASPAQCCGDPDRCRHSGHRSLCRCQWRFQAARSFPAFVSWRMRSTNTLPCCRSSRWMRACCRPGRRRLWRCKRASTPSLPIVIRTAMCSSLIKSQIFWRSVGPLASGMAALPALGNARRNRGFRRLRPA